MSLRFLSASFLAATLTACVNPPSAPLAPVVDLTPVPVTVVPKNILPPAPAITLRDPICIDRILSDKQNEAACFRIIVGQVGIKGKKRVIVADKPRDTFFGSIQLPHCKADINFNQAACDFDISIVRREVANFAVDKAEEYPAKHATGLSKTGAKLITVAYQISGTAAAGEVLRDLPGTGDRIVQFNFDKK